MSVDEHPPDRNISFTAELSRERDRRGVVIHGELATADGPPPRGAAVRIEAKERGGEWASVGEVGSDPADGTFSGLIPIDSLPTGRRTIGPCG